MSKSDTNADQEEPQPPERKTIGLIETSAQKTEDVIARLSPPQQALREAAVKKFKSNKLKAFIASQTEYVNGARQIGEAIQFLFDREGRTPKNVPIEDIVAERKRIERNVAWLEALAAEMRNSLVEIREIEDSALDLLEREGEDS